ncbi:uncharacterized protein BKCO1_1000477 [Diplodia corticola]|uniref:Uncharacterized protein n=1 Tax=Diplodia corticola TaxID=236234 RepID=A0A1J9SLH9_9PEZI|nr:uncharacterized protein BKCO1_1000477 [Diplodia corticola]OJD40572.1 hypothetical protein BKCO1_1000477 [Diplodia corticola]
MAPDWAKQARRDIHMRIDNTRDVDTGILIESQFGALVGEIYDAMISGDRPLDLSRKWAGMTFIKMDEPASPRLPIIPQKMVVALAYRVARLICDGYRHGFRYADHPPGFLPQEVLSWPARKAELLEVLRAHKYSVEIIFKWVKPAILSLIYSPTEWILATQHPFTPVSPEVVLHPRYSLFGTLAGYEKRMTHQEIKTLLREMYGRSEVKADAIGHDFTTDPATREDWVKAAYNMFVSTEAPEISDARRDWVHTAGFTGPKMWSERSVIARIRQLADIIQDGAQHGFIRARKTEYFRASYASDDGRAFTDKLIDILTVLEKDKTICFNIMFYGRLRMVELVEAPWTMYKANRAMENYRASQSASAPSDL